MGNLLYFSYMGNLLLERWARWVGGCDEVNGEIDEKQRLSFDVHSYVRSTIKFSNDWQVAFWTH